MTDVFFSYSSKDRERVRPIRDALVAEGFDVFWDQEVPPGRNWDEWIRQHLDTARCAIVFWSGHSVKSDNVMHEATVAKNFGKLIPVLLDPIEANQFPMGHYTTQALVIAPEGIAPATLQRLSAEVEAKAMRRWMRRKMAELEGRVASITKAREQDEDRENVQHRRISELETELEQGRRERVRLQTALTSATEKLSGVQAALTASQEDLSRFKLSAQTAQHRISQLENKVERGRHECARLRAVRNSSPEKPNEAQAGRLKNNKDTDLANAIVDEKTPGQSSITKFVSFLTFISATLFGIAVVLILFSRNAEDQRVSPPIAVVTAIVLILCGLFWYRRLTGRFR